MTKYPAPKMLKTKIIERPGNTIKMNNMKSDNFKMKKCYRDTCLFVWKEEGCNMLCYKSNINYEYTCNSCGEKNIKAAEEVVKNNTEDEVKFPEYEDEVYKGESSRSMHIRNKKHNENYRAKKASFMYDHMKEKHEGIIGPHKGQFDFKPEVTGHDHDPLRRITREAVRIRKTMDGEERPVKIEDNLFSEEETKKIKNKPLAKMTVMNSKREFFLPRMGGGVSNIADRLL